MSNGLAFSDEELTSYLDGEADAQLVARIQADHSTELAAQLAVLERGRAEAGALFGAALGASPAFDPNLLPAPNPVQRMGFATGAVSGALAAGLAAMAIWWSTLPGPKAHEPWHWDVAAYHALYIPATLAGTVSEVDQSASLTRLSEVIGRDLTNLPRVEGLDLRRAQNLGFKGKPLIQIAYLGDGDVPMALCILAKNGAPQDVTGLELAGMAAAHWADERHRFILIGGQDAVVVQNAAELFAQVL